MDIGLNMVPLGKTELQVTSLGIGAWAWGDRTFWGFERDFSLEDIQAAFQVCLEAGINFFDTAELYAQGRSETLLGEYTRTLVPPVSAPLVIATKFLPLPWRLTKNSLLRALRGSLRRLGMEKVDLYQIHAPVPPIPIETWADALADAVQAGLVSAVGVSNFNEDHLRRAHLALTKRGVPLASNQIEYHLLNRKAEFSGLLAACRELEVSVIAYSPLAQGVLSGKYTAEKPPQGVRSRIYGSSYLEKVAPLLNVIRRISRDREGATPAQVAINWTICQGTIPIPGVKNARQAQENTRAASWRLNEAELAELDQASRKVLA